MAVTRSPQRRRQRSIRVTIAVLLLTVGTALGLAALVVSGTGFLQAALVTTVVLGWVASRLMWTEILTGRREHSADRSLTSREAANLAAMRAAQNDRFVAVMTARMVSSRRTVQDLAHAVSVSQHKAAQLELQARTEQRRADANATRIAELQQELADATAAAELHRTGLSDLMSFEDRVKQASTARVEDRRLA